MTTLSIVVLSYNTKDLTLQCIESIVREYKKELEDKIFEIIVVDNASIDDSGLTIGRLTKKTNLKIIQNSENVGFGKGCNIGAEYAKGKFLLFLNSDTRVLDRGFLQMVNFLDSRKDIGILGGKLLNPDGNLQRSGGKFYNLWYLFLMLLGANTLVRKTSTKIDQIDWVSGACMMIKSELFNKLAGFDEHFFMYVEDMELCYRMKKLGFLTYFYPFTEIEHKTLGSSNRTFAIISNYKGILYFYSKHRSGFEYIVAKTLFVAKAKILIFIGIITVNPSLRERYEKALKF